MKAAPAERGEYMDDGMILDAFFARDETAIRETDAKYGERLRGISKSITGSLSDAEECVSDAYLAAWNRIPPTRPDNYYAYLCRIVRNISCNLFHKNTAMKRSANILSLDAELSEIIPDLAASFDEGEVTDAINGFLLSADKDTRHLFVRRYFYADSLSDLSRLTKISENGIASRLSRIRKKLKDYLEKEGFDL